jgi:simple sugar transport system permease protein
MSVSKNYVLVMAACGAFAGLAGSLDVLGWQFRLATNDIQIAGAGFIGIAVALLGRNTALGTAAAALLFGALLSGTSQRNLDASVFEPLAANLTYIIQGLVIVIVSADVVVLGLLRRGRGFIGRGTGGSGPAPAVVVARSDGAPPPEQRP